MSSGQTVSVARSKGLRLICLGAILYVIPALTAIRTPALMGDFMAQYFPARSLLHHSDPYSPEADLREYEAQGPDGPGTGATRRAGIYFVYPPVVFPLTSPFALLPLSAARLAWTTLGICLLLTASFLVWDIAAACSIRGSGFLIAFQLANSETLAWSGNPACLAIALSAIGACCLVQRKHTWLGVACLAVSMVLKPHDSGLVWLYFLLAGPAYRKKALQALVVAVALAASSLIWVSLVAPQWPREMARNLAVFTPTGGANDPGPSSSSVPGFLLNLQTVASRVWNASLFYDLTTYLICGVLIGLLALVTLRSEGSSPICWLPLASLASVTMLVVTHRRYDTKLLILAVPACAMLWAERGRIGRWALAITGSCFLFTGDGFWIFSSKLLDLLQPSHPSLFHILQLVLIVLPAPLSLLAMSIFYLWVYAKRARRREMAEGAPNKLLPVQA